mmetsp:Transcript_16426/g.40599  ORF Transcript_16426/g.40599 Transcript_16426/m.40599 type:complete len:318 (+) Transcript_16426:882-1835(+)|eukprot:CAMPEP_0178987420 /NCGR_PEP_ID=MMETSP0795-20121207/3257_1 /TAXON_ID=88552 /ORGANISM="Amoebophrya sp., Strain Ameob2" /LENGTH=317 /DNA_ID=CAMNT_0020678605 /DNA_START=858 /DNA_END=1811 /DNA_ORIENTATION=+
MRVQMQNNQAEARAEAEQQLEEVFWCDFFRWHAPALCWCRVEGFERLVDHVVELEYGCDISAPVAVIWRGPHSYEPRAVHGRFLVPAGGGLTPIFCRAPSTSSTAAVHVSTYSRWISISAIMITSIVRDVRKHPFVALHHQLVRPRDQLNVVHLVEGFHHVAAEEISRAPRAEAPAVALLGIAPEQIAHGSVVGHLALPVDRADLVQIRHHRREPPVHAKNLVLDQRGEREVVENFGAVPPDIHGTVLAQTLVVETVHLGDLPRFVVSADQKHALGIPDLQREQQQKGLHGVEPSVYEVAHEEVACLRAVASDPEEF